MSHSTSRSDGARSSASSASVPPGPADDGRHRPWAEAGALLAAVLLLVQGVLGVLQGVAAVAKDDVYAVVGHYAFRFDLTAWGWIHIALGVLLFLTGLGVLRGTTWARVTAMVLAGLAVIANFMWLPYTPVWAVIGVGLGLMVIWSLSRSTLSSAR
ncbi:DUF7144 family membrane protein [Phaeacidiphilus oryzae]|jgi:hypothetical protein|uniref:DUF7144 family membrane protein n=1 Tax=Phaeacidiphilus oryzae TaxID=348818 RepID=UPI00056630B8|nr:hypothetical protein [Phaeacidiphilus oryzae]